MVVSPTSSTGSTAGVNIFTPEYDANAAPSPYSSPSPAIMTPSAYTPPTALGQCIVLTVLLCARLFDVHIVYRFLLANRMHSDIMYGMRACHDVCLNPTLWYFKSLLLVQYALFNSQVTRSLCTNYNCSS